MELGEVPTLNCQPEDRQCPHSLDRNGGEMHGRRHLRRPGARGTSYTSSIVHRAGDEGAHLGRRGPFTPRQMSDTPTLEEIQHRLKSFRDDRDRAKFHSPANLASAISIEGPPSCLSSSCGLRVRPRTGCLSHNERRWRPRWRTCSSNASISPRPTSFDWSSTNCTVLVEPDVQPDHSPVRPATNENAVGRSFYVSGEVKDAAFASVELAWAACKAVPSPNNFPCVFAVDPVCEYRVAGPVEGRRRSAFCVATSRRGSTREVKPAGGRQSVDFEMPFPDGQPLSRWTCPSTNRQILIEGQDLAVSICPHC